MKRNYQLICNDGSIFDDEYRKNEDFEDRYGKNERRIIPCYVDSEEDKKWKHAINYCLSVSRLLQDGRSLSELIIYDFRQTIKELFIKKGWSLRENTGHKNNGGDIIIEKLFDGIHSVNCICLPKKYLLRRKVGKEIVEDLEFEIYKTNASMGCLITSSTLTRPAIKLINENSFRMFYMDHEMLEKELGYIGHIDEL